MRVVYTKTKTDYIYYLSKGVRVGNKVSTIRTKVLGRLSTSNYKTHEEALSHFRELAKQETIDKPSTFKVEFNLDKDMTISSKNTKSNSINIGYFYLDKIYRELNLTKYLRSLNKDKYKFEYDIDEILRLLVYSRILYPASKKASVERMDNLFGFKDIDLTDVYRSLDVLQNESNKIQEIIYDNSKKIVDRNTSILYYDCTNFFFETETEDLDVIRDGKTVKGLRKYGLSKENRPNPIVEMGLFIDKSGIPLGFTIESGNTSEQSTTLPLEKRIVKDYELSKFIYCSDAGLGSMETRKYNSFNNRAFICTRSLKKVNMEALKALFDNNDWKDFDGNIINLENVKKDPSNLNTYYKVIDYYEDTTITLKNKKKKRISFKQKLIITFSNKYKIYQENIRDNHVDRAEKIISKGSTKKENINDPNRYVLTKHTTIDGTIATKEIKELDKEQIDDDSIFDGYYALITNLDDDPREIIKINRDRWQIEESFRIMKTSFKSRPVYLAKGDHIKAHFLTCFISLVIYRLLEKILEEKYTTEEIIDNLKSMNVISYRSDLFYASLYENSEFINELTKKLSINLEKEAYEYKELKKILRNNSRQ